MNDTYDASRLPKHGQAAIAALRQEIERLARENADLRARLGAGMDDSDTFADPYSDTPRPLGTGVHVRFNGLSAVDDTFDVRMLKGDLDVRMNGTNHEVAIIPVASNHIKIRMLG